MARRPVVHLVFVGVVTLAWTACRAKTEPSSGPDASASASASGSSSAVVVAAAPVGTSCEKDTDCLPLNCCFALKPDSCIVRARTHCDAFDLKCEAYTGPHYACACVRGECTGNPAAAADLDADGGAKIASWATGDLAPSIILGGIIKHAPDVRACHALAKKASGQVSMAWTILPTGKVDRPVVIAASIVSPPLTACLLKKVAAWRFPKAKGPTRVTYDFRFGR
jgi:hypothetical protein